MRFWPCLEGKGVGAAGRAPEPAASPASPRPGQGWLRDFPGLGVGGIKILSLGKRDGIPLVVSWEVSTRCPCGPGELGSLFLLLHCPSSTGKSWQDAPPPRVTHAPGGIPWELWSCLCRGCPSGQGGLGEAPGSAEGAEPFAGWMRQPKGTYSRSRRPRLGSGGRDGRVIRKRAAVRSSAPLPASVPVFMTPPCFDVDPMNQPLLQFPASVGFWSPLQLLRRRA